MAMDELLRIYLKETRSDMFDLLRQLVCINSGSHNKPGVDAVGRVIANALADCDLTLDIIETKPFGNPLIFRTPCRSTETGQVLLVGPYGYRVPCRYGFSGLPRRCRPGVWARCHRHERGAGCRDLRPQSTVPKPAC